MPEHFGKGLGGLSVRQRHPRAVPPYQINRIVPRQMIGIGGDESIQSGLLPSLSHRRLPDQRYSQKRHRNQPAHQTPSGKEKHWFIPVSIKSLKWIKLLEDTTLENVAAVGAAIVRGWVRQ